MEDDPSRIPITVLVVDSDPSALAASRRWLERNEYEVEGVRTCAAARARIHAHPPNAILLDILLASLPGGSDLIEELRCATHLSNIPVILVSIVPDSDRGLAWGSVEVLKKSVAEPDLRVLVEAIGLRSVGDQVSRSRGSRASTMASTPASKKPWIRPEMRAVGKLRDVIVGAPLPRADGPSRNTDQPPRSTILAGRVGSPGVLIIGPDGGAARVMQLCLKTWSTTLHRHFDECAPRRG